MDSKESDDDDDDSYTTADEGDGIEETHTAADEGDGFEETHTTANVAVDTNNSDPSSNEWTYVTNKRDLPKVNTTIECKFPDHSNNVTCTVLSKAGKSSTASWHFLNIKEGDEEGKCCSFKNAAWKPYNETIANDTEPTTNELFYGDCDSAFDQAKHEEMEKWKLFKTFIEVPDKGQKTISTRWVCTRKIKGGKVQHKARSVARGFEENCESLRTDSPTCSKEALRLTIAIISSNHWKLHSIDIKSAFLQGTPMQRNVLIKPPKEAKTDCLWKMLKCPYGLADAGRLWYMKLKEELIKVGMVVCKYDQALFTFYSGNRLSGVLTVHVDDILFGGEDDFHKLVVSKIKSTFAIGCEDDTNFKYLGLEVNQSESGISVSTEGYSSAIKALPLPEKNQLLKVVFHPKKQHASNNFADKLTGYQCRVDLTSHMIRVLFLIA